MNEKSESNPLVSVIIPTYNASKTIDQCLESIVNQTYKNIEIICCDDCSTDNTMDKLLKWKEKDARIVILSNIVNSKAGFSRNQCIKISKGEYIAQIDDDDYSDLTRIEKQVKYMNENKKTDFLGTSIYFFDDSGIYSQSSVKESVIKGDFLWGSPFANPSIMFKTSILREVDGYRVSKDTVRGQDYDLFMRLYTKGFIGENLPEPLTFYRRSRDTRARITYKHRIGEAKIRLYNYPKLGLMPIGILYILKPLILGLISLELLENIKLKLTK